MYKNPEEEMNREDNHEEGSLGIIWKIYSIQNYKLDIQFPYYHNKPTHRPQVIGDRTTDCQLISGFYFDPPTCLQHFKSGCICIDNKDEFCLKYAISAVDNYD